MNGSAFLTTLAVHAGAWGVLASLPVSTRPPAKMTVPVSILYRKPPPAAAAPLPVPAAVPAPPAPRRRRRSGPPRPQPTRIAAPPALLMEPAAPAAVAVAVAAPPAAHAADLLLPKISEEALPEGYVQEDGFTFAPLYRVTKLPRLRKPLQLKYPDRAREFQKEGVVIIEVDIDTQGRVVSARIIEEPGWGFGEAALKAVRAAGFSPAQIGETAVPLRYRIPIRFKMDFS